MATLFAIPTLAGKAAILASIATGDPIELAQMVVGDGNGNPVIPLETQTALVNQRAVVPLTDIDHADDRLTVDALLDENVGGFTIREAGILNAGGELLFVASSPAIEKRMISEGVEHLLTLGMIVVVAGTANVTLSVEGSTYASHDYVNAQVAALRTNIGHPLRIYHLTVRSLTLAAPPLSPTPGDIYLVPVDATGAWAGQTGKLAQYVSLSIGWLFVTPPVAHVISDEATGLQYQRAGDGKYYVTIPANPGSPRLWLHDEVVGGVRSRGWSDPFNITGLATFSGGQSLALNDELAIHDVSAGVKIKVTVQSIANLVQSDDERFSEAFFFGSF